MAQVTGRISDADKERIRDACRIEAVVGDYVALKRAGSGNVKGLCPFHDEKTPSFTVSTARGFYHCFGCGEGGDVFDFLMKMEQLTFVESVQQLAERVGISITLSASREHGGRERTSRSTLTAITKAAAAFYAERLGDDDARDARTYLTDRGFDGDAATQFDCGFAPSGWDRLIKHLARQGFSIDDMFAAGVARRGARGPIDQFHRRLTWAIRDAAGDVVGFGARRIFDDDKLEAKYVNTSGENRLYRKSRVLYGLNLAKRDMVRHRQAVIVEGYTDVMAMHLAGVTTAVATCGTAFGDEHIEVLRRYLMDSELMRGEVIYIFDGDAAGQKAALKAFDSDQKFAANTFIAVAPDGMDPCELRQDRGDGALRDLVRSRTPLFRFAINTTLADFDLETVEGRTLALAATAPLVARIKDTTARSGYVRELAERIGVEPRQVAGRVRDEQRKAAAARRHGSARRGERPAGQQRQQQGQRSQQRPGQRSQQRPGQRQQGPAAFDTAPASATDPASASAPAAPASTDPTTTPRAAPSIPRPDPANRGILVERETIKLALQYPQLVSAGYAQLADESFTDPAYRAIHGAIRRCEGPGSAAGPAWAEAIKRELPAGVPPSLVTELAVEAVQSGSAEPDARYAGAVIARMAERAAAGQERELASALQRATASGDKARAAALNEDLTRLAVYRRALADRAAGAGT